MSALILRTESKCQGFFFTFSLGACLCFLFSCEGLEMNLRVTSIFSLTWRYFNFIPWSWNVRLVLLFQDKSCHRPLETKRKSLHKRRKISFLFGQCSAICVLYAQICYLKDILKPLGAHFYLLLFFVFQSEQDGLWEAGKGTGQEVCPHIEWRAGLYPAWAARTDKGDK